jgi:hypothetical protein
MRTGPGPAARQAALDRNLMLIRDMRRDPPDTAMAAVDREIAQHAAVMLAEEFGTDTEVAGRAIVAAAMIMRGILVTLDGRTRNPENIARTMINAVSLTGERMVHGETA